MMKICQNCNTELQGRYCSNCGQSSDTHRINVHFLWHDIQHGLFHLDKGIFFTAKELFTRPGNSIREFIEGKRIQHFKPISFVLVLAGIYGFLSHFFHINLLSTNFDVSGSGEKANQIIEYIEKTSEWLSNHYSVIALLSIPIFSVGTYLSFKKSGYNFIEHFVINSFIAGQRLILHIVTFPLCYIYNETSSLKTVAGIIDLFSYGLMAWTLLQLFNRFGKTEKRLRTLWSFIISFAIQFVVLILILSYIISSTK